MKTPMFKPKFTGRYESAPTIHTLWLPRDYEQIRHCAQANYRARGGMIKMTLIDWLKAEQQLKQQLIEQTDNTNNHERNDENDKF